MPATSAALGWEDAVPFPRRTRCRLSKTFGKERRALGRYVGHAGGCHLSVTRECHAARTFAQKTVKHSRIFQECEVAGRQGVPRIVFRLLVTVREPLPSLSDSASSATAVFSSAFFRLPTFADFTGVMSLKMSLAAGVS